MTRPALQCQDVRVTFGGLAAVAGISYDFLPGRVYGVIGPNGAGKTTFMNALSGQIRMTTGRVMLGGTDITGMAPHLLSRAGLGRSFQISKVFAGMTVFENLRLAALAHERRVQPFWRPVGFERAAAARAKSVMGQIGLTRLAGMDAATLSHGDQRALEIGLALVADPKVLLLDEPLAGVGQHDLSRAIGLLNHVLPGRTVLLIEHNMDAVMKLSDEILVLAQGQLLAAGSPEEIKRNPSVRHTYLGEGE